VTDLDALFAAVIDRPDDDNPRLVYAECLEEQSGDLPDPDAALARAEFIRVQVELARLPDPECLHCWPGNGCRYHELRRRERKLSEGRKQGWFPNLSGGEWSWHLQHWQNPTYHIGWIISRGFVDSVTCDLRTWCGGECDRCGGSGQRERRRGAGPGGASPMYDDCPDCRGTGRVVGIGPAVVRAHPVRRVVLTDREPRQTDSGMYWYWCWENEFTRGGNDVIPDDVINCGLQRGGVTVYYPTRAAALDALSAALLAWAKSAPV
jgi:uncharacterized protein (TIGR02996 family)